MKYLLLELWQYGSVQTVTELFNCRCDCMKYNGLVVVRGLSSWLRVSTQVPEN